MKTDRNEARWGQERREEIDAREAVARAREQYRLANPVRSVKRDRESAAIFGLCVIGCVGIALWIEFGHGLLMALGLPS